MSRSKACCARHGSRCAPAPRMVLAIAGNALKAFPGLGTLGGGVLHAFAYALIFDSLGRALAASLAERRSLDQADAGTRMRDLLARCGRLPPAPFGGTYRRGPAGSLSERCVLSGWADKPPGLVHTPLHRSHPRPSTEEASTHALRRFALRARPCPLPHGGARRSAESTAWIRCTARWCSTSSTMGFRARSVACAWCPARSASTATTGRSRRSKPPWISTSVDMGDGEWDKAVRGADLLDADRNRTARYVSDSVEKRSDDEGVAHGKLTLRGVTLPLDIPFRVNRVGKTIYGLHTVAGFFVAGHPRPHRIWHDIQSQFDRHSGIRVARNRSHPRRRRHPLQRQGKTRCPCAVTTPAGARPPRRSTG